MATLDDAAFGAATKVTPKFVSPSDPAAQWTGARRGPAFFAYSDNYLIDVKAGSPRMSSVARHPPGGGRRIEDDDRADTRSVSISSLSGSRAIPPTVQERTSTGSVQRQARPPAHPGDSTVESEDGNLQREALQRRSSKDRNVYICPANKIPHDHGQAGQTTERHFTIGQKRATVVVACSRHNAVQRRPSAKSRAVSTRKLATLPGRWPRRRRSSNHRATGSVSKCCLRTPAYLAARPVHCAGHAVPSSSSRWQRLRRAFRRPAKLIARPPPFAPLRAA